MFFKFVRSTIQLSIEISPNIGRLFFLKKKYCYFLQLVINTFKQVKKNILILNKIVNFK